MVISQKRHFQKKHKNNLLFKHFISSLQSCIRVKYISVGFKFTLENETSEIFGVILNHNSFHIDKALPCRGQIKEQLYILIRLAIPFGKFQDTTAYSYVYVFVLFWWFWRSIVFFIILTSTEKSFKHQKVQIFVMQSGYAMTMAISTNAFSLTVGSLAPIYVNVVKTNVNSIHPQTENDVIIPFSWKHNGSRRYFVGLLRFSAKTKSKPSAQHDVDKINDSSQIKLAWKSLFLNSKCGATRL